MYLFKMQWLSVHLIQLGSYNNIVRNVIYVYIYLSE